MVFKYFVDSRHHSSGDLEGHEEPEEKGLKSSEQTKETPEQVVDDFNPTEDGEASEKTHRASYEAQLGLHCHL